MAPTESTILNNFLLVPSQLPAIVSLEEFTNFFPRSQRSSPLIRALYRDLQSQRNELVDSVASNIEAEVKRAKGLRRAVARARREAESQEYDDEMEIERTLFRNSSSSSGRRHDLNSILPELESAINEVESEIKRLEDDEAKLRHSVSQAIGSFSDLRYGRLANGQLPEQVLEGLSNLQAACEQKM